MKSKKVQSKFDRKKEKERFIKFLSVFSVIVFLIVPFSYVQASSHREAPLISSDPKADNTDLYVFVSPDKPNTLTLIANVLPFEEPAGGPNFYRFDDNVLYEIKIDNVGDAKAHIIYQFRFKSNIKNPNTFLYNTGTINNIHDATYNYAQSYTLTKVENGVSTELGTNIPVPPDNIGAKSTPNYPNLQSQSVTNVAENTTVFAGQSDDPFFADIGGIFDLLTIRKLPGNMGSGIDGLGGYNVQSLALQIPVSNLTSNKTLPANASDPHAILGIWTTTSRQQTSILRDPSSVTLNENSDTSGNWTQISRLGAPLVNEVVIPLSHKDQWNASSPEKDTQFANYVANPELGKLLKSIYGIAVPPQEDFGLNNQRDDLEAIYLTGIAGINKPENVVPAEELRLNTAIPSSLHPNRLGILGGDLQGFPNGRRLNDDVVDISEQAVAGAAYPLFHKDFKIDPLATKLGDGVNADADLIRPSFPYLALPHDGLSSVPHTTNGENSASTDSNQHAALLDQFNQAKDTFNNKFNTNKDEYNATFQKAQNDINKDSKNAKSTIGRLNQSLAVFNNSLNQARDEFNNIINNLIGQL